MRTVIIGIGNPVLTDDGVGLQIADRLAGRLQGHRGVAVTQLCCGGLHLMEAMAGYERAIIIDAIVGGGGKPGTVYRFEPASLALTRNTCSSHDASLPVAIELGAAVGLSLPKRIRVWAVEADDVTSYGERLTPEVARAVPLVVGQVIRDLRRTRE
jgi:hydrogenase maturation protease